ncbi:MAG TPA: SLC13 family permease [Thermoanaerobaculia bacterium]|jgi:di/tricarboxylate transporter|nr:SLC13 family permease [Thermoanaerobaculia bacterium]
MTLPIFLVLALLAAVVLVFSFEWVSVDIATLVLLAVLVLSGILTVDEAFSGFSNEIIVILAAIFVLSGALMKGGVLDHLSDVIHRFAGGSRNKVLLAVMPVTSFISSFMNNTTCTAVMMPAVLGLCRKSRVSPGKVLIPLAYASMLGGTCTLIGTSTNVAASAFLKSAGLAPISMFEFLPVGVAVCVMGILYVMLVGHRLLPDTREAGYEEQYSIREYLSEVVVTPGSPLAGQALRDSRLGQMGLQVRAVLRGGRRIDAEPALTLQEGDLLLVQTTREGLLQVKDTAGIEIKPDLKMDHVDLASDTMTIAEAILMPQSTLVGRTIKELDFRRRFGVTVIAIYRSGHALATRIGSLPLRVGDVLLIQGRPDRYRALADNPDLLILQETEHQPARRRKGWYAVGIFLVAVVISSFGWMPLPIAFLLAALAVIGTRLITMEEAYGLIDWRLLILIAGMTSFGVAMRKTGAAEYLAGLIVGWTGDLPVSVLLFAFGVLTILLTQPMSNAAAALVVLPVAMNTATKLGHDPRSFAVMVTLSASLSFITPFEPSCLIVYGPGRYRFRDFLVCGLPLTALVVVVLMLMVPWIWPLG